MTATAVGCTPRSDYFKPRVSIARHADRHEIMQYRGQAAANCILQAVTYIQPTCVRPGRQLHRAFRPASAQFQQQGYSSPLTRAIPATAMPGSAVVMAAAPDNACKAATVNSTRIKAAFAEAGLSQDAISHILARYPHYQGWNVEQKLLPALQRQQQELGARFPSEFRRTPKLLLKSTEAKAASKAAKIQGARANAPHVKAALVEAGLSQAAITRILKQYPSYMRWDVEQKLLPAMQSWQRNLGASFLSEFERIPTLLLMKVEEEKLKEAYLISIGVTSPTRVRQRSSVALNQPLASMQGKVAWLYACGFTQAQVTSLVEVHPDILQYPSKRIQELMRVIGDMFDCARDMDTIAGVMLSCKLVGLWSVPPTTLRRNWSYFCTCIGEYDKEMSRAWRFGVFITSPAQLDCRLDSLAAHLGATIDKAKGLVRSQPQLSLLLPERVGLHVTQMLDLGFSHDQVKSMCLRQPSLLTYSYNSDVRMAKLGFLTSVLQLSHEVIAAHPHLLMSSLPNRLGPRWEYLQQLRLHGVIAFSDARDILSSLVAMTDPQFRAAYSEPQLRVYDEQFQKQWQTRWDFLLTDQQLSAQDIANNPDMLRVSLKDM